MIDLRPPGFGRPADFIRDRADLEIPARTGWGEAEGEPIVGQIAVVWVMRTRAEHPKGRYGRTLAEVCRKPWQFSCWNEDTAARPNPRLGKVHALEISNPAYLRFLRIVLQVALGELDDPTGGCTHYHVAGATPKWARGRLPHIRIGNHVFYKGVDP